MMINKDDDFWSGTLAKSNHLDRYHFIDGMSRLFVWNFKIRLKT